MTNTFFDPGDQRAAKVHDLFAQIARRYDLINDLQSFGLHRHWKRRVIQLACPQPGQRALDLCCGTGDLALGLARRRVRVVGLDFSEPMLAVAATNPSAPMFRTRLFQVTHHVSRITDHPRSTSFAPMLSVSRSRITPSTS